MAPCTDCVKITGIELDSENRAVVKIGIKHPFPAGDPGKPVTGRNRADLHVFNVEGTIVFDDVSSSTIFPGIGDTIGPAYLVNADGYTPYPDIPLQNIFPTNATLHPYILHFDDYSAGNFNPASETGFTSVVDPPPSGNLVMAMGCNYDVQDYVFNIPGDESINFIYAIGCTYALTTTSKTQRFTPEYQVPQHNKKAASEVGVEITSNNLVAGDVLSTVELQISVLDINHGVAVGDGRDQMKHDSSVSGIVVEIPSVTMSPETGSIIPLGGNGRDPSNPLKFSITIQNEQGAGNGIYTGLVKVVDSYPPDSNDSALSDGLARVDPGHDPADGAFQISEFATYQVFKIEISSVISNNPPIVEIETPSNVVCALTPVDFWPGAGTYDPDADNLVLYEYDFDYNGITFDVEDSNTNGDPVTHQFTNTSGVDVDYTVALRVTDDGVPPASGIGTVVITVKSVSIGINFLITGTQVPWWSLNWQHGIQKDPAICLESDSELSITYILKESYGPTTSDTLNCEHSTDGINWVFTAGGIGAGGMAPPVKIFPDLNDGDSYTYYSSNEPPIYNPDYYSWLTKSSQDPYEYSWFNLPFDHAGEAIGSLASGYIFVFGDDQDRLEVRRSMSPHVVADPWTGPIIPDISDTDPRISWIRSVDELEDGSMFLAYFNSNENVIKRIKSDDIMGNSWTEGTVWQTAPGEYNTVKNPGIFIDSADKIHLTFVRREISSSIYEICYTSSTDGGTTFSEPVVAVSSANPLPNAPVLAGSYFGKDVVLILYEENGDIKLTLSDSGGLAFCQVFIVSDTADPNKEPDFTFDSNGDLVFVWEITDPVWQGSVFYRKAEIVGL
jgi:hypothetical protein